jgi:hypothetical protein
MSQKDMFPRNEDKFSRGISLENLHIFRFHKTKYLYRSPDDFYQTFLDSEHSIKKTGRFCPSYINPGFFFALTKETSLYEFLYHNDQYADTKPKPSIERVLDVGSSDPDNALAFITCEVSVDNILDLCNPESAFLAIKECYGKRLFGWDGHRHHFADLLLNLADIPKYGNRLTDALGEYAWKAGFNGIRFLSARAIDHIEPISYVDDNIRGALENAMFGDDSDLFGDLLVQMDEVSNLVLFRGAYLAQKIKSYSIQEKNLGPQWQRNDLWQKDRPFIERIITKHGGLSSAEVDDLCCAFIVGKYLRIERKRS